MAGRLRAARAFSRESDMDPFVAALDALFKGPGSLAAQFVAAPADPIDIRVIRSRPDQVTGYEGMRIVQATNIFEIRVSDVAQPIPGNAIVINPGLPNEAAFSVLGDPVIDVEGLTWVCGAEPV